MKHVKKALLSALVGISMTASVFAGNSIPSTYSTFSAPRLQNVFPHTVSKDGSLILEGKLTATDYASILLAATNVQNNSSDLKNKVSGTYSGYVLTSEFLFLKPDGSVISTYDHVDGQLVPNNKVDIASVAQYSIAFYDALSNNHKFDANPTYQKRNLAFAALHSKRTAKYIYDTMYQNGRFFEDTKKDKVTLRSMGNGLVSFSVLYDLEKDPLQKKALASSAKTIYDVMNQSWKDQYEVFDFEGDGSKIKFDLRDLGFFLWGSKELAEILAENGNGTEALQIMKNTHALVQKSLVHNITYKSEGIVREIEITNGKAASTRDEINTGRLHTFLYGYTKWNESPYAALVGIQKKNIHFVKNLILYSIKDHMDEYGLLHDTKFSDVTVKNDAKETPYLTWYMTTADYMLENYKTYFTLEEFNSVEKSIQLNYDFLMNRIYMSGAKLNEMSGF